VWLEAGGIDPSIFFDDDGRVWLHGTRLAKDPRWHDQTEVWLRELDPGTMTLVGPEHVLWHGAVENAVWAEAPHLYKIDGRYYLLAAEGGTEFHHAVSVARSEKVTGPYEGCRSNPILTHRHLGRSADVVGVGHADLVQAVDGSWWAVLLGMRPYGGYHYNLGRETFLVPVTWEDGWPVLAPGVGRVPATVDVPGAAAAAAPWPPSGTVLPDDPRWTSLRAPADTFATPHGEGWLLRVRPATLAEPVTPSFLGLRQQHHDVDVTVTLRVTLAPGEHVGLVVRQSERDHMTLHLVDPTGAGVVVRAVHRSRGLEDVLGEAPVEPFADGTVRLRVRARGQDYAMEVETPGGVATVAVADGRALDTVATGGFLGLWFGVFATSNGRRSTTVAEVVKLEYRPVG
jgi:alpha-N-arabinofuranosidase